MRLKPLERVRWSSIRKFEEIEAARVPVVIADALATGPATLKWSIEQMKARFGEVQIPVRESDDELHEFFGRSEQPGSPRMTMTLVAYLQVMETALAEGRRPPYAGNIDILRDPVVSKILSALLSDYRFPAWQPGHAMEDYRLWIGAPGQRSTIHNDPFNSLNAQIAGAKHFILFAPDQHPLLYPEFFHRGLWASPIDVRAPDLERYPKFAEAEGFECLLAAGEMLYVPRFWWHAVEACSITININRWLPVANGSPPWWHQQSAARDCLSYAGLLERIRRQFQSLPPELQALNQPVFGELEQDLFTRMSDR